MGSLNRFLHPLVQSSIGMRLGGAISGVAATLTLVAAATPRYMSVCNVSLLQPPGSHELQIAQLNIRWQRSTFGCHMPLLEVYEISWSATVEI